ncbi:MAG: dephospho-CoA kinase [Janthinobacterium lividum]
MKRIGITGGIGSGKSVVARLFAVLGVPVYDSDTRAKWVMANDLVLREQLLAAFGPDTYDATGQLNRLHLTQRAFSSPEQLAQLNGLVHPRVGEDFAAWSATQALAGHAYVLKEAALLYESGAYQTLDSIITVFAPVEVRTARVLRRDAHRSPADVEVIMSKQLSEEEKLARADYVVFNDDSQLVLPQVLALDAGFRVRG